MQKWGGIVLAENVKGSEDEGETEAEGEDVRIRVCEDGDWAGGVVLVIVSCPCETDAVEGAVDTDMRRNHIEELDEGGLLEDIAWSDEGMLWEAKVKDDSGDPSDGAGVWTAGPGDEDVGVIRKSGRAEER